MLLRTFHLFQPHSSEAWWQVAKMEKHYHLDMMFLNYLYGQTKSLFRVTILV